ncbi:MAG: heat-inducible transcription repressor HrcA [Candidatus Omnitrophota bacterium]|nr:MAG: heat-inducible transcription repressor HrcA [Candidatus Omnitrophota bacterium]
MTIDAGIRRNRVLKLIINTYITSGNPVSSRTICAHSMLGLCPASIRNIMADLEEQDLITHLHTSAGRIPTDKGYRFYVDNFLSNVQLSVQDQLEIADEYIKKQLVLEEIIAKTSQILSDFTHCAGVISLPLIKRGCFKVIRFIDLGTKKVCITLITDLGITKSLVVCMDIEVSGEVLKKVENFMNSQLKDVPLVQIKTKLRKMMIGETHSLFYIFKQALELIDLSALVKRDLQVYFEGISNILSFSEFTNSEMMCEFVKIMDEKSDFIKLMQDVIDNDQAGTTKVKVLIGNEKPEEIMEDCTVILSTYKVNSRCIGALGVIGPRRMNYARSIATVEYVADHLSDLLDKFSF